MWICDRRQIADRELRASFCYLASPKSLTHLGKLPLLLRHLHDYISEATSERPLLTGYFCPNCNRGQLGGRDKVNDYTNVLPTLGATFQNCTSTIFVLKKKKNKKIIQSFRAAERIKFTFEPPPPPPNSTGKFP